MIAGLLSVLMLGKGIGTYVSMALTILGQVASALGSPEVGDPLREVGIGLGAYTVARAGVAGAGKK